MQRMDQVHDPGRRTTQIKMLKGPRKHPNPIFQLPRGDGIRDRSSSLISDPVTCEVAGG